VRSGMRKLLRALAVQRTGRQRCFSLCVFERADSLGEHGHTCTFFPLTVARVRMAGAAMYRCHNVYASCGNEIRVERVLPLLAVHTDARGGGSLTLSSSTTVVCWAHASQRHLIIVSIGRMKEIDFLLRIRSTVHITSALDSPSVSWGLPHTPLS
jgi:hypothetical protein